MPILIGIQSISFLTALLFNIQLGESIDLYHGLDISFYYFTPLILWLFYLPLIYHLSFRFQITNDSWKRNIGKHILISLIIAPASRVLAIALDFSIKGQLGWIEKPVATLLMDVRWTIMASSPKEIFFYWMVLLILVYNHKKVGNKIPDRLSFYTSEGVSFISLDDILWIKAAGNYILIRTVEGEVKSRKTFKVLLNILNQNFIRIHRSIIINKDAVTRLQHWRNGEYLVTMKDGSHLSSTRTYLDNIRRIAA